MWAARLNHYGLRVRKQNSVCAVTAVLSGTLKKCSFTDAALDKFSLWWTRAKRCGYAFSEECMAHPLNAITLGLRADNRVIDPEIIAVSTCILFGNGPALHETIQWSGAFTPSLRQYFL